MSQNFSERLTNDIETIYIDGHKERKDEEDLLEKLQ